MAGPRNQPLRLPPTRARARRNSITERAIPSTWTRSNESSSDGKGTPIPMRFVEIHAEKKERERQARRRRGKASRTLRQPAEQPREPVRRSEVDHAPLWVHREVELVPHQGTQTQQRQPGEIHP